MKVYTRSIITLLVTSALLLFSGCDSKPETFEELLKAGQTAFVRDDYSAARDYLGKAVTLNSSNREALYFLGISYQRDYTYDSAMFYLKRADILYPDDREINIELYKVCVAMDEWRNAIKALNVLIETGDRIEDHYGELADLNIKNNNFMAAYIFYGKLIELQPDNRNWYLMRANVATELDSLPASVRIIDSAIARFGELDELMLNKSLYLTARRQYSDAEKILRGLLAKDSTHPAYRLNLANLLSDNDDREKRKEALAIFKDIRNLVADERFNIDSTIAALENDLNLK